MISLMKKCNFLISDSGGIQEEASFLNKCVIVCRRTTERPETIGTHSIMCSYPDRLIGNVNILCRNYKINRQCPYGDGMAWVKIKDIFIYLTHKSI
jgi:UDP-N-acetylglucosamine 2-epimerase (non-hydrolysing)